MTGTTGKNLPEKAAKILSVLMHPLFMPVYCLAIILSSSTPFGYLPSGVKRILFLIVFVNNIFLPVSLFPFLRQMNFITSWNLDERKERNLPLLIISILYATSSYIMLKFPVPVFLKTFIFSTFILSLVVTLINFKWKISLHAAGAGALIGLVLLLFMRMYFSSVLLLVTAIIAGALVLSSRMVLKAHNPVQVWSGFATGLVVLTCSMLVLQHLA